ncbi:MAG: hypothetical protein FJ295_05675 [Planctomycetes bacterium]|nr:hypothetical protein [Planctomycetota bacterium]
MPNRAVIDSRVTRVGWRHRPARTRRRGETVRGFAVVAIHLCAVGTSASLLPAADSIVVQRDGQSRTIQGEILDYTGTELKWRSSTGREETVPAAQVIRVRTEWTADQMQGDAQFDTGRFEDAAERYRAAQTAESRLWVKRQIAARLVACYRNLGQWQKAAELFLALIRNDAKTQYVDHIPLSWSSLEPDVRLAQAANEWVKDDDAPAGMLIGSSLLLSLGERGPAVAALERLGKRKLLDPRIAALADAQLWRTRLVASTSADLESWRQKIARMSSSIQAGPCYLLAQGLARHEQREEAAMMFLRGPLTRPVDRVLASEALLAGAAQLETMERQQDAAVVYRELVSDYGFSDAARQAEDRLRRLESSRSP